MHFSCVNYYNARNSTSVENQNEIIRANKIDCFIYACSDLRHAKLFYYRLLSIFFQITATRPVRLIKTYQRGLSSDTSEVTWLNLECDTLATISNFLIVNPVLPQRFRGFLRPLAKTKSAISILSHNLSPPLLVGFVLVGCKFSWLAHLFVVKKTTASFFWWGWQY